MSKFEITLPCKFVWINQDEKDKKKEEEAVKQPIASPVIDGKKYIGSGEDAFCENQA